MSTHPDTDPQAIEHLRDLSRIETPGRSIRVYCPYNGEAGTNFHNGTHFCRYCGNTTHEPYDEYLHDRDAPSREEP